MQWYFSAPDAAYVGMENIFGDGRDDIFPWRPQLGMTREWEPNNAGNPNGYLGVRPCGTPQQWLEGCLTTDPVCDDCIREDMRAVQEIPAGLVDGMNRVFTLSETPIAPANCLIFVNGLEQVQGGNYSISGPTIHFSGASTPTVGSNVVAYYWVYT